MAAARGLTCIVICTYTSELFFPCIASHTVDVAHQSQPIVKQTLFFTVNFKYRNMYPLFLLQ